MCLSVTPALQRCSRQRVRLRRVVDTSNDVDLSTERRRRYSFPEVVLGVENAKPAHTELTHRVLEHCVNQLRTRHAQLRPSRRRALYAVTAGAGASAPCAPTVRPLPASSPRSGPIAAMTWIAAELVEHAHSSLSPRRYPSPEDARCSHRRAPSRAAKSRARLLWRVRVTEARHLAPRRSRPHFLLPAAAAAPRLPALRWPSLSTHRGSPLWLAQLGLAQLGDWARGGRFVWTHLHLGRFRLGRCMPARPDFRPLRNMMLGWRAAICCNTAADTFVSTIRCACARFRRH